MQLKSGNTTKNALVSFLLLSLFATSATSLPRDSMKTHHLSDAVVTEVSKLPSVQPGKNATVARVPTAESEAGDTPQNAVNAGVDVRVGEEVAAVPPSVLLMPSVADETVERAPECLSVGSACNIADECCSKRCLTYAHKCVT